MKWHAASYQVFSEYVDQGVLNHRRLELCAELRRVLLPKLSCSGKTIFGSNQNLTCFGCFTVCFMKPENKFSGFFQFVSVHQRPWGNRRLPKWKMCIVYVLAEKGAK